MYAAGLIDSDPSSLTSEHAEDAATARAIVQRYHNLGYEEIKIYQSLKPELSVILNNSGVAEDREERAARALQTALNTTRIIHDAGIPILAGSDQVVPSFSLHRELELLVRAGLSPIEAIRAATSTPTEVFGLKMREL